MEFRLTICIPFRSLVCWDTFDSDEIWAQVPARRTSAPLAKIGIRGEEVPGERRRSYNTGGHGRWQRGVALPPSEDGARRKDKDANSPNDLWDDPVGGATGAAMDFSAFGDLPEGGGDGASMGSGDAFDFDKMTEASRKFEEELHGPQGSNDDVDDPNDIVKKKVDAKRPLATVGTTIRSGSGDDVNVFEDFDDPDQNEGEIEQPAVVEGIKSAVEDPSASSRLMAMIGVKKEGGEGAEGKESGSAGESPWNGGVPPGGDTGILGLSGPSAATGAISLNPWGDPIISTGSAQPPPQPNNVGLGMDLASRLESFAAEQKAREAAEL